MAKKRTRKEKIIARLRKQTQVESVQAKTQDKITVQGFYYPEITLPVNLLRMDLTRTILVTILALILQGSLFWYLFYRDGYQLIIKFMVEALK
jgi:hypothetical protein